MIGPRRGGGRAATAAAAAAGPRSGAAAAAAAPVAGGAAAAAPRRGAAAAAAAEPGRGRSRSRGRGSGLEGSGKRDGKAKGRKEKEFAWMDSDDDDEGEGKPSKRAAASPASSRAASSSPSSPAQAVPIDQVQTLAQMAKLAPGLEQRLRKGELRSRELCEVARALARSKFFDPGLFGPLSSELRRACHRRRLGGSELLETICALAELNAYDAELFEVAVECLRPEMNSLQEPQRQRLEAALKKVNHTPGEEFFSALKACRRDRREACPMFWRGQCKWGPKCKLSHDQESFEDTATEGKWRPPSMSGGKSVGFKQSADLFREDRCGALW